MGLDITVPGKIGDVLRDGDFASHDADLTLRKLFIAAQESLGLKDDDAIHTRPGSYRGVHLVRAAYAKLHGISHATSDPGSWQDDKTLPDSHLVRHCDAEGWYLPDEFDAPIWAENQRAKFSVSIGSSVHLLNELRELDRDELDVVTRWAWDALFVAAVASVKLRVPIEFH